MPRRTGGAPSPSLRRRRVLVGLGLGWSSALAVGRTPAQVPAFSDAPPQAVVAPGWRHQTLPGVARANDFALPFDEGRRVVRVASSSSASSWVTEVTVDPRLAPVLRWRWKVARSLAGSDLQSKDGDDYAARLYVLFDLPSERLSLRDRLRIQTARLLSGAEVPAAALCYVWGRSQPVGSTGWNPYTDRVRMIVVDSGDDHAMQWREVRRDVVRDWADSFGGEVPLVSGVAIGADTDNTGDRVEAWFGDVSFREAT